MVLKVADVALETDFLAGSIVNAMGVQTAGQESDGFYDLEQAGSTFNITWEE